VIDNAVLENDFGDHLDVLGILVIFKQTENSMPEINLWILLVIDNAVLENDFGAHLDVLGILGFFKQTDNSMTEIDFWYF